MANYEALSVSNMFRVTDEEKYNDLFNRLVYDIERIDKSETDANGQLWHGFCGYGDRDWIFADMSNDIQPYIVTDGDNFEDDDDPIYDFDMFLNELQKIIHPDDVFVLHDIGYEKLRYVHGQSTVLTKDECKSMTLSTISRQLATSMGIPPDKDIHA